MAAGYPQPVSQPLPYLLLGDARSNEVRQRLLACVDEWQRRWFGTAAELEPLLLPTSGTLAAWSLRALFSDQAHGPVLQLGATAEFIPRLLGLQSMSAPAGSSSLPSEVAEALQTEVLQRLGEALMRCAGLGLIQPPGSIAQEAAFYEPPVTRRWFHASIAQPHSLERLCLLLHPCIIERLTPLQPSAKGALVSRRKAITPATVRVEAWLGETILTLDEFATLRLGDVLVLESDRPAYLTSRDQRIATLQPGRQRMQRAVSIGNVVDKSNPHGK
jgi:hypothetical protein